MGLRRVALVLGMCWAAGALGREVSGMQVPDSVSVAGRGLRLSGAAVQRKFVFDVYAVAMWLERPTRNAGEAVSSEQVKRIQLRMLRSASRGQVAQALRSGFERTNPNFAELKDRLERLLAVIPDLKDGDNFTITYVPGQGTTLESAAGGALTLPGSDFGQAMFNIWLGSDPGTQRIKGELLRPE